MKNIEQNKNYSAMIYSAMTVLVIAVFFFSSFLVFADDFSSSSSFDTSSISFSSSSFIKSPLVRSSSPSTFDYLPPFTDLGYQVNYSPAPERFWWSESGRGVYFITNVNGSRGTWVFCSESPSDVFKQGNSSSFSSVFSSYTASTSSDGLYYFATNYDRTSSPYGLIFNSLEDGLSAVRSFFASSSSSASLISTSFQSVSSTSYIKSTKSGCAGYAYYYDGTYYNLVVGNINSTAFVNIASDSSQHPVNLPSLLTFDDTPIYYNPNAMRVSESDTSELGYFTNLNAAVEAIYDVLDVSTSEPSQNLGHPLNLALQPGNVAFIDITGLSEQYFTIKCNLSGLAYYTLADFNSKMNYMIGYSDTLPASFSLPIDGTSKINWTVERGVKPTVTGTYNQFYYSDLYSFSSGKYLVVVNPVYENIDINSVTVMDINAYNVNNILNISMEANDYYVYSLSVSVGYQDGQSTYETGSSTTQYAGTYDPSTESWQTVNTATNEPESPSYGGDVQQPTYTPEQESKRFVTWLQDFLKGFVSIFDAGKTAIMTLVGYAGSFFAVIGSLYAWLPPPVYSVLISGIILVITIGIIKAFI